MDDVRAVMDAVGSERAALIGESEGGPMSMLFAASFPSGPSRCSSAAPRSRRTRPTTGRGARAPARSSRSRWPLSRALGPPADVAEGIRAEPGRRSGGARLVPQAEAAVGVAARGGGVHADGARHRRARRSAGDSGADADPARGRGSDLPRRERPLPRRTSRAPARRAARRDHVVFAELADAALAEIREFLTGVRESPDPDRVLATVLFTDLVGSTNRRASSATAAGASCSSATTRPCAGSSSASAAGDRHRGRRVPRRLRRAGAGIRCAEAIVDSVAGLGLQIRAGVHTGECEVHGDKLAGLAVHVGARVAAQASSGEVLVSNTVQDLIAGSGIELEDRGLFTLKGLAASAGCTRWPEHGPPPLPVIVLAATAAAVTGLVYAAVSAPSRLSADAPRALDARCSCPRGSPTTRSRSTLSSSRGACPSAASRSSCTTRGSSARERNALLSALLGAKPDDRPSAGAADRDAARCRHRASPGTCSRLLAFNFFDHMAGLPFGASSLPSAAPAIRPFPAARVVRADARRERSGSDDRDHRSVARERRARSSCPPLQRALRSAATVRCPGRTVAVLPAGDLAARKPPALLRPEGGRTRRPNGRTRSPRPPRSTSFSRPLPNF